MNESPRFLITTALEDSWVSDAPVVFLGEWCRMYSRQARWKCMDAKVVPFHWNDRTKLNDDYEYLCELYERALPRLASHLNEIHGVNHSLRYWRILIGPWLAYFIHILFDRWSSIQQAIKDFAISETILLTWEKESMVPKSMEHFFSELMVSNEWNHSIYAYILEKFTPINCIKKVSPLPFNTTREKISGRGKSKLIKKLFSIYSKLTVHFVKKTDVFLIATYLSAFDEFKLHLRFRQIPQLWKTIPPSISPVNWEMREWSFLLDEQSDFEKCLSSLIPMQIPATYLEGYRQLNIQIQRLPWPKSPPLIFTSNVLWHDSVSMAYIALNVEHGARLVYGQHGGYGLPKFMWSEKHEIEIADCYLTWGWSEQSTSNLVPVGVLKPIAKYRAGGNSNKSRLLLVRGLWPPYTFRLDSCVGLPQLLATIDRCLTFAGLLTENLRNNYLTVRLYPLSAAFSSEGLKAGQAATDFYCEELRWKNSFPSIQLSDGSDPMANLVAESRLVIYSYNGGTGYLEFMAADVPVIAFWDMSESPVRDSAIPYFDELKRVGIFHETPESLAAHVSRIWDDVDGWWKSANVQEVLAHFKTRYCLHPDNILDRVEDALQDVLVGQKQTLPCIQQAALF